MTLIENQREFLDTLTSQKQWTPKRVTSRLQKNKTLFYLLFLVARVYSVKFRAGSIRMVTVKHTLHAICEIQNVNKFLSFLQNNLDAIIWRTWAAVIEFIFQMSAGCGLYNNVNIGI